jgi:hypothetical protein
MNLSLYIDDLRRQLAIAAEAGGDDARDLAERLTAPLESAARLVLLEALSAAADEITRDLAPGTVEVRLRGGDPAFVVTRPSDHDLFDDVEAGPSGPGLSAAVATSTGLDAEEGGTSRLNLRLPDPLKNRIEEAARSEGLSLNAWIVRAAAAAIGPDAHHRQPQRRGPSGSQRYTGWVR